MEIGARGTIARINVDENPSVGETFGVRGIPFLAIVQDGKVVEQIRPGSAGDIVSAYDEHL